jgi:DNA-binding HxlR family transcriptional regulator
MSSVSTPGSQPATGSPGRGTDPGSGLTSALARVGDRWSLLVVAALLDGPLRFKDLAGAVEGIAPNILADRLRRLGQAGVLSSEPYSERPLRLEYRLTEEGQELAGALRMLADWGRPMAGLEGLHHAACGTTLEARWYCPTCASQVEDEESSDLVRL